MFSSMFYRGLILSVIALAFIVYFFSSPPNKPKFTIALTQIVDHASLNKVRQGIIDKLAALGYEEGKNTTLIFKNAQGNIVTAAQIADQFSRLQPDVVIAIATPSAQAVVNKLKTDLPIVFASITDPLEAKLVENLQRPGKNVTGTRNVSPIEKEIKLIKEILPTLKNLGIILSFGESNSVQTLNQVKEVAKLNDINIRVSGITNSADVPLATKSLVNKVHAILLLQDNTVASALPAVLHISKTANIPVFSLYLDAVKQGALAGIAFDEYAIGEQTAEITAQILQGKKAGEIAVRDPSKIELGVNLKTAKQLNLILPLNLIKKAQHRYE